MSLKVFLSFLVALATADCSLNDNYVACCTDFKWGGSDNYNLHLACSNGTRPTPPPSCAGPPPLPSSNPGVLSNQELTDMVMLAAVMYNGADKHNKNRPLYWSDTQSAVAQVVSSVSAPTACHGRYVMKHFLADPAHLWHGDDTIMFAAAVIVDTVMRRIIVAVRGSVFSFSTPFDLIDDSDCSSMTPFNYGANIMVAAGFMAGYKSISEKAADVNTGTEYKLEAAIIDAARSLGSSGTFDLYTTGHSLGSPIATLLALKFKFDPPNAGSGYTIRGRGFISVAGPTPGGSSFACAIASNFGTGDTAYRYVNRFDIVPLGYSAPCQINEAYIDNDNWEISCCPDVPCVGSKIPCAVLADARRNCTGYYHVPTNPVYSSPASDNSFIDPTRLGLTYMGVAFSQHNHYCYAQWVCSLYQNGLPPTQVVASPAALSSLNCGTDPSVYPANCVAPMAPSPCVSPSPSELVA